MDLSARYRGCLLGLACGDAVGTTVEFQPRGSFKPLTDMVGGGPFRLPVGAWTDDTSMALCLATSLIECKGFDPVDQMTRYCRWRDDGYLSCTGECFDIGSTTSASLWQFNRTGEPFSGSTDARSAGNGCIMRLAPVPLFYFRDRFLDVGQASCPVATQTSGEARPTIREAMLHWSAESSRTTHGAPECLEACRLMSAILHQALEGASKDDMMLKHQLTVLISAKLQSIADGDYRDKKEYQIRGSGYAVECLEAALWCFHQTDTFRDAILRAANLGDDADTTAAVCGQIAGAFYGETGIPIQWLERLVMVDEIRALADGLM